MRELHRDLAWLGADILLQEIMSGRFGDTTRAAMQMLQKQYWLEPEGVMDTKTIEAINKKLGGLKRILRGNFAWSGLPFNLPDDANLASGSSRCN